MKNKNSFPTFHILLVLLIAAGIGYIYFNPPVLRKPEVEGPVNEFEIYPGVSYEPIEKDKYEVSIFASNIPSLSSIIISPDDEYMLASSLNGNITAFVKQEDLFIRQALPFFTLNEVTSTAPGFPEEYGLTGITFAADFEESKTIFLFYSEKDESEKFSNKVAKLTLKDTEGIIVGEEFKVIFEANTEGNVSHQIQKGVGIMLGGKSHVLFSIGEGFQPEQALDKNLESGKLILIAADGDDLSEERPFSDLPNLQAIGIRNVPGLAIDTFDSKRRVIVLDTGPDRFDRFIYSNLFTFDDKPAEINFNWDGTLASLEKALPDPNFSGVNDMVLHRWDPTITATNIEVHKGKNAIPVSDANSTSILLSYFGLTGDTSVNRGKQIVLGVLKRDATQPSLTLTPIIQRTAEAQTLVGNPLGLAIEGTGDFYFGDIIEGRIYKVKIK